MHPPMLIHDRGRIAGWPFLRPGDRGRLAGGAYLLCSYFSTF
jgi:hypothetical protein